MTYDLNALKDALAKMTPGEWEQRNHPEDTAPTKVCMASGRSICVTQELWGRPHVSRDEQIANAAGIVALVNAAPALIADHLALQARVAELEAEVARLRKFYADAGKWRAALGDQP